MAPPYLTEYFNFKDIKHSHNASQLKQLKPEQLMNVVSVYQVIEYPFKAHTYRGKDSSVRLSSDSHAGDPSSNPIGGLALVTPMIDE